MIEKLHWIERTARIINEKELRHKINELVDVVNELQDKLATNSKMGKAETPAENVQPGPESHPENVQNIKDWIGKLCWFWNDDLDDKDCAILSDIPVRNFSSTYVSADGFRYKHCDPVRPDDEIIFKGK